MATEIVIPEDSPLEKELNQGVDFARASFMMAPPPVLTTGRMKMIFQQPSRSTIELAMYRYAVRGLSPIMFDRMTAAQVEGLITGAKVDYGKEEPLVTKATRKLYSDHYENDMPAGYIGIPNENLYASWRDTGKKIKYGSGAYDVVTSGTNGTLLYCMIRLIEPFIILRNFEGEPYTIKDLIVDTRKGNATQGTGAVGIVRPKFMEWGFVGHMYVTVAGEYVLPERQLERLINQAGLRAGLCSARPGKQMPFGQNTLCDLEWIGGAKPRTGIVIDIPAPPVKKPKKPTKKELAAQEAAAAEANGETTPEVGTNGELPPEGESPVVE